MPFELFSSIPYSTPQKFSSHKRGGGDCDMAWMKPPPQAQRPVFVDVWSAPSHSSVRRTGRGRRRQRRTQDRTKVGVTFIVGD